MADETSEGSVPDAAIFERVARCAAEVYGVELEGLSAETTIGDIEVLAVAERGHPFDRKFLSVAPALVLIDLENEFEIEITEEEISDLGDSEGAMPLGLLVDIVQRKLMEKAVEAEEPAVEDAAVEAEEPAVEEEVPSEEVDDWDDDWDGDWDDDIADARDDEEGEDEEAEQERFHVEPKARVSGNFHFCPKCGTEREYAEPNCRKCGYKGAYSSHGEHFANETFPKLFKNCLTVGFFVSLFLLVRGHTAGIGGMVNAGIGGMAVCVWFLLTLFVDWGAIEKFFHRRSGS